MLSLSANSDFNSLEQAKFDNPYYDWDGLLEQTEIHGTDVIDQMIEQVLLTEPHERLFNLSFGSPIYKILFENMTNVNALMENVYDIIERWVPIHIDRNNCDIEADPDNHAIAFQLPYITVDGLITGVFKRRIRQ